MFRIYCSESDVQADTIRFFDKEQIHHLKDVLRINNDEEVVACDEKGNEYISVIDSLKAGEIVLRVKDKRNFTADNRPKITIACAIPKKSNMDEIIDKLTQLGAHRIIPLQTERVIVRIGEDKKESRRKRWVKIALSASRQSQRKLLPLVDPVRDIKEVLADLNGFDLRLIPTLDGERLTVTQALKNKKPSSVIIFIGPEGDFTPGEVAMAKKAGCVAVSLGELVLRVETAAVAIAGFLRLYDGF